LHFRGRERQLSSIARIPEVVYDLVAIHPAIVDQEAPFFSTPREDSAKPPRGIANQTIAATLALRTAAKSLNIVLALPSNHGTTNH
jgi:hypothetical protein